MSKVRMPEEERFTRSLFGVILILSFFAPWGKWVALVMGILFLISASQGICLTCILYKKLFPKRS